MLDIVMDFLSTTCLLGVLVLDRFSVPGGTDGRNDFGQNLFRFNTPSDDGSFAARDFLHQMAGFWTREYHLDEFRVDDFADVANWDFKQRSDAACW